MPKRSYNQFCGLARALDAVGERWTMLIARELLLGPRRFKDLLDGLPGIGTNILAARLKGLEAAGVLRRRTLPPPAGSTVYELTEQGRELAPALLELARWGAKRMGAPRPGETFRPAWGVLAMRVTFRPEAAGGVHETYQFHVDDEVFHVRVDDGHIDAVQGPASNPDLVVETDTETFLAVGTRQLSPEEAGATGRARAQGDPEVLRRFLEILALPEPQPEEALAPTS